MLLDCSVGCCFLHSFISEWPQTRTYGWKKFQDPNYTTEKFRKVIPAFHSGASLKSLARVVSSIKWGSKAYTRIQNLSTFQPFLLKIFNFFNP